MAGARDAFLGRHCGLFTGPQGASIITQWMIEPNIRRFERRRNLAGDENIAAAIFVKSLEIGHIKRANARCNYHPFRAREIHSQLLFLWVVPSLAFLRREFPHLPVSLQPSKSTTLAPRLVAVISPTIPRMIFANQSRIRIIIIIAAKQRNMSLD